MKPKHTPKKIRKREEDEPHISHRHADRYSQSSWSAGIRRDPPMSMNLAQAVQALSSHVTPRWNPKAMASQPKSTKPVQRRQNVPLQKKVDCFRPASTPRITEDPQRQPARGQIPLRPDLAQIKYFMKQDVVCSPVTPTTPRKVTPGPSAGPSPGPSTSNMGPHGRTVGPSSTNAESPSVAHSVRSLQLCSSSSSDSSPSPQSATLPYRRIVTTFRTRHYRNQLERYKTLRGEKRLQHHKIRLQQLYETSRDSAGEEPPAEGAQADGPSGNQQSCPEEVSATCRTVKRKWRQCSDRALTKNSGVLCKTPSCRSWSRKLESNSTGSSESSSPAPLMVTPGPTIVPGSTTFTTTATAMATTTAATATAPDPLQTSATPGSLGASHNFDINLFLGDTGSPRSKAVRRKGTHGERGGQTTGISSGHARPNEVKARDAQGDVGDSPSAKTTPRKHVHFQDQSRSPGTPSSMKSASVGDFGEALTSGTPYKPVQNKRVQSPANKAKGSVVKTERNHVNSPLVKTPLPSTPCTSSIGGTNLASNVEAPALNIVVKPKSSCSSTSSVSNQLEIDTKRPQGTGAKQHNAIKRTARAEPKPKSAKAKQNPLPDTPRPKMVKSSALLPRSRVPPLQVCESPSTPRSVSSCSHPEKTQTPAKKKEKEKACLPSALKNTSTEGPGLTKKKPRVKQPKSSSANNPSKGGRGKSKASGESAIECGVTHAASDERKSNVEQTHLAANGDESQATGGVSTSSAQQGGSSSSSSSSPRVGHAPEKKRRKKEEPWSKKKYLLEKLATAEAMSAEQSPSPAPGTGSATQLVTQEITSEAELPPLLAGGTSTAPSGDTTACQIQIASRPEPSPSTLSETEAVSSTSSISNHQAAKPGESGGASNGNVKSCDTGELTTGSETEPKSCNSSSPQRPHPSSVTHTTTTNSSWGNSSPQSKMADPPSIHNAMVAEPDGEVKEPENCQPSTSTPPQSSTSSAGTSVTTSEEPLNPTEQPLNGAAGGGPGSSCDATARGTDKRVPIAILLKAMRDNGDSALPSTSGGSHGAPVELPLTPDPGNETAGCSMAFVPGASRGIEVPDPSSCHARTVLTDTLSNQIVTRTIKGFFSLLGIRTTSPTPIPTPATTSAPPCQQPQQQHQQYAHQQQYMYLYPQQQQHPPHPHPYLHQHQHPQHQYHQYRQPTQQTALLQHPTPTRHASQTQTPLSQIYCYARTPTPRLETLLPGSRPPLTQVFSPHLGLLSSTPPLRAPPQPPLPPPPLPHRPTERITDERDQTAVIDLTQMPDKEDGNL